MNERFTNEGWTEILNRKGPTKTSEMRSDVQALLDEGRIETVNLTEWLLVDQHHLLKQLLHEWGLDQTADRMLGELASVKEQATMKRLAAFAEQWIVEGEQVDEQTRQIYFERLATHRSDTVRCWAAFIVGKQTFELAERLQRIRRFAADLHFGVREVAWLAVRESVAAQLPLALSILQQWVLDEDANIRRFAVEVTRPRGVWARHIPILKQEPEQILPLIQPLLADPSKYVQDSVANWLNDASKTRPEWVIDLCRQWSEQSQTRATAYIVKRAQRSI